MDRIDFPNIHGSSSADQKLPAQSLGVTGADGKTIWIHDPQVLQMLFNCQSDEIFIKDRQGRFLLVNTPTAQLYGLTPDEMVGKTDFDFYDEASATGFREEEETMYLLRQPVINPTLKGCGRDMRPSWYQVSKFPLMDEKGEPLGLFGLSRRITDFKQTEAILSAQSEILEMIARQAPLKEIFTRISRLVDEQLLRVHGAIALLKQEGPGLDYVISHSVPKEWGDAVVGTTDCDESGCPPCAWMTTEVVVTEDIATDPSWASVRHLVTPFGYVSYRSIPIVLTSGTHVGTFALFLKTATALDTFEARLSEMAVKLVASAIESHLAHQRIRDAAERDGLTRLYNRATFSALLEQKVANGEGTDSRRFGLAYIDLDDFKLINDRHGHEAGDRMLKTAAERMVSATSECDTIGRFGGDEFVLILVDDDERLLETKVQDVVSRLHEPLNWPDMRVDARASVGMALYPDDADNDRHLLGCADTAMYHAKRRQCQYLRYDPDMDRGKDEREAHLADLRHALAAGEIEVDFQPQYSLSNRQLIGFEALARWQHPRLGRLGATNFIQLAEVGGLILPLGEAVLRAACKQTVKRRRETGLDLTIAVNVSAYQFDGGAILGQVIRALDESGLDPSKLEIELTETVLMRDAASAKDIMTALKALNVQIALDDFGTGYSNLGALATFPLNRLKIDRSIVRDVAHNSASADIAAAIIAMAHKLHMNVLAEGVENAHQLEFLINNRCDAAQGFFLGKPARYEHTLSCHEVSTFWTGPPTPTE